MIKNRVRIVVLSILLGLTPLAGHADDELFDIKAASQHIEQGIAHLKAKNYDAAIDEFEETASIYPEAEAYYYLGYAYYYKGRAGDEESRILSRENFEKAYEIDPNFTPTRYQPPQPPPEQLPSDAAAASESAPQATPPSRSEPPQQNPPVDQPKQ